MKFNVPTNTLDIGSAGAESGADRHRTSGSRRDGTGSGTHILRVSINHRAAFSKRYAASRSVTAKNSQAFGSSQP